MSTPEIEWSFPEPVQVPNDLAEHIGGHPIVAQALFRRGIRTIEAADAFLFPEKFSPSDPFDLPDMQQAVQRIRSALHNNEKIGIWGDFDVDGQTSTTLLVDALRKLGGDVVYHIPVRKTESHGIKIPWLSTFLQQGIQLLITCDTGITAHEAVDYANKQGVPVIITDHHQLGPTIPEAFAAVNPQRLPADHPLNPLCGVGCAYQVIKALYGEMTGNTQMSTDQFLDLVALGTIADVAELRGDNRWLVQRGLAQIQKHPRKSINALLNAAEVILDQLDEGHISFQIAPRLNALGRLDDANPIVEFFLSEDEQIIQVMTARLEGLNGERRFQSSQIFAAAQNFIAQDPHLLDYPVLVLSHPEWIGGVVGIVASHLVEIYNRPVILLTTPPGKPASGSARSIPGVDITRAIASCQDLLNGFGGHPMAAGLSLPADKIPAFRSMVSQAVTNQTAGQPFFKEVAIDSVLNLDDLSLDLARDINRLAPFGPGNPELNFLTRDLQLKSSILIGKTREHRQMIVEDQTGLSMKFLWWKSAEYELPAGPFDLAFNLRPSSFRGTEDILLTWVDHQPCPQEETDKALGVRSFELIDHRGQAHPLQALQAIQRNEPDLVIWGENLQDADIPAASRIDLVKAQALVIWTTPPEPNILDQVCEAVSPVRIYLFDQQSDIDLLNTAREYISTALNANSGWIDLPHMAANCAQTEVAVRTLVDLFIANGNLREISREESRIQVDRERTPANKEKAQALLSRLQYIQTEIKAYRRFYSQAKTDALFGRSIK